MAGGQATDEELLSAVREGDLRAFDALYDRYERRLFGYLRRVSGDRDVAEDLFQDVFITVIGDRTFDPAKGRFSAWLFTVARNRCLEVQRRAGTHERKLQSLPPREPTEDADETLSRARDVRAAMDELTDSQRQLLLLKQVGELTYRELADIHGVAEGTIKSRLHTAMKAFRRRLAEIGQGT